MNIDRRALGSVLGSACVLAAIAACNVFDPPPVNGKDAGLHDGTGGGKGSGGNAPNDTGGSVSSSGGADASVTGEGGSAGGSVGGTGGKGGSTSTGGGKSGGAPDGEVPSGPTDPWWPHNTVDNCQSAGVPSPSDRVPSDPGATMPPIYFAMNRFLLGAVSEAPDKAHPGLTLLQPDPNAWEDIGFDLDGVCTNSATCKNPTDPDKLVNKTVCANGQTIPFDGNQCVDNSIGKLFVIAAQAQSVGDWFGLTENDWNCELWRGGFSEIYKISNYNGQYNDNSVQVDLYTSTGLKTLPQWSCRTSIDQPLDPNWNTHAPWPTKAHWIISEDSISLSADQVGTEVKDSKWEDRTAFVRGGWLVAQLPDATWLWLNGERTVVPGFREIIHRGILAARLVHDPQSGLWSMEDGVIGFVATPGEMLEGFAQLGFCDNMCGTFDIVKDYLNTYQDSLSTDNNAPIDTKCDSLSYGQRFRAAEISADSTDVLPTAPFTTCPQPRHPDAPRQGCTCSGDGQHCYLDAGK